MNSRIAEIAPSVTLGITSQAKAMTAAGKAVFSFAAGEPDFDTPSRIKAAAVLALEGGKTKYAPVAGLAELREAIATKLREENGLNYSAGQVVVSNGAKHSLFNLLLAMCSEGEEVIIPSPYWLSYPEMVRVSGARSVFVACREEDDYKLTPSALEAAITDRTVAVILNSPSNPTGSVYSGDELRALADVAVRHGVYMISDEIYEKLVYDGVEHVSVGTLSDEAFRLTITVNGFSKSAAMTGWRLGYLAGPKPIVDAVTALQSHSTSGANTFAQYGALAALKDGIEGLDDMVRAFGERRDYIYARLSAMPGIRCTKPAGAFYVFPAIEAFGMDSVTFAERLLNEQGVAVVPGEAFGADGNVRLSYACSMTTIREGMDRLETFVEKNLPKVG